MSDGRSQIDLLRCTATASPKRMDICLYLRKMALDGYILRLDLPELKEMLSQLRYMGNNVNQIAKRANEVGVIDEMDIRGVSKRQERMLEQMARLLEKLSGLN